MATTDIRMGDTILLPIKVQSINPGITCYGETPSKQNVAFAWHEIHSVIKRAETPEEEIARLKQVIENQANGVKAITKERNDEQARAENYRKKYERLLAIKKEKSNGK